MALVFSSLFVILALWFTLLNMGNVTSLFKNNNRGDLYLLNYTQKLDHFDTKSGLGNFTFQQRLLVNDSQWNGPKPCVSPPIFAYLGGVDEKLVDPGQYDVLSSFAVEFKGILISIEHRFTGGSIPLDSFDLAMANSSIKASLTIDNVLQDFADIIQSLKANYSAKNAPVIVVGTGYGGALAAWFRMKYPHIAIGAHATSTLTPLLHYYGTDLWCRFVSNNTKITHQLFPECRFLDFLECLSQAKEFESSRSKDHPKRK